jgi:hypothetical protein
VFVEFLFMLYLISFSVVTVVLCPVGGAPIMRQRKWEVDSTQTIGFIASFIRKKLTLQKSDSLVSKNATLVPLTKHH